jgi:NADH-quinone oxidoreductase subunit L
VPLTVLTPFIAFVLAATSVRTRRSAANMALLGAVVTLALSVLVAWGLTRTTTPFQTTYTYLTVPVAFTGAVNFQNFAINIVIRVDRLTAVATVVVDLCVIGALAWHRVMGRTEPGGARFYALVSALLFAVIGTLVSQDLAEMFAFWGLAGAATYLLLSHRWGSTEASRGGRIALVLPFVTDLSLLCGIAVLYAHYGVQTIAGLVPILHTTLGVGLKSLVAASVLIFVGVAGRLAIWPFHSWITRTVQTSPSAASAMAQSVWSVVAIVILYRLMPIVAAANTTTLRWLVYACAVSAIAAPLLALFGNELRRTVVLAGVGTAAVGAALVVHSYEISSTTFAVVGVVCVLAAAPARAAATMAASAIAGTMRTEDLAEMGDGWRRIRATTTALLLSGLVISFSAATATAFALATRSRIGLALGEAVLLISIAGIRAFLAVAFGPLRRRRAFEPDRVREAPNSALGWPYWLAVLGAVLAVASLVPAWVGFLDAQKHNAAPAAGIVVWLAVVAAGILLTALAYRFDKDGALRASAALGSRLDRLVVMSAGGLSRFIFEPVAAITVRVSEWIPQGDGELARAAAASGRLALAATRAPAVPLLVTLAVVLALAVGLFAPGLFR